MLGLGPVSSILHHAYKGGRRDYVGVECLGPSALRHGVCGHERIQLVFVTYPGKHVLFYLPRQLAAWKAELADQFLWLAIRVLRLLAPATPIFTLPSEWRIM